MDSVEPLFQGFTGAIIGFRGTNTQFNGFGSGGQVVRGGTSGGLNGGDGRSGKVGWIAIRVEEGGVGTQRRVRLAESQCERSRVLSCSS